MFRTWMNFSCLAGRVSADGDARMDCGVGAAGAGRVEGIAGETANKFGGRAAGRMAMKAGIAAVMALAAGSAMAQTTAAPASMAHARVAHASAAGTSQNHAGAGHANLAGEVNAIIGTGGGPGGGNNLFPGATTPFGMVQLSPDTESQGYGYHYDQAAIQGFSMTHMSGPGCSNEGDVFFTATTGAVTTTTPEYESGYQHDSETATAGYYQVKLTRWDVNAELTATDRTGEARFTFPAGQAANVLLPLSKTLNHATAAYVKIVGDRTIEGYVINQVFCGIRQTYKVNFVMTFDRPFAGFGTWNGLKYAGPGKVDAKSRVALQLDHDQWIGAYATWPAAKEAQTVVAKIGISYVDMAGARNNLKTEAAAKSFNAIRTETEGAWNKALGAIDVTGGSKDERTVFYTALYHSLLMPTIFSDADGRYLGFDARMHEVGAGHAIYDNYSGWDIYRSEMPLVALIDPARMEDMAQSIVLMYKQGGWIGRWPEANVYTNVMAGSPLSAVLATAWVDGLHGFDMKAGWEGMWKDAMEAPPAGHTYIGEEGVDWINKVHFVPDDKVKYGSVSQMQEDGAAYASLYWLAKAMGKTADAKTMQERALDYRNEFNAEDRFFRPRRADGTWVTPFDPDKDAGFIEGSGWHYQWMAQWDMAWLVKAMGQDLFNQRLTEFFNYKTPGWYGQYYNPYNETDLEAPFEFNFSGEPWETQRVVRRVLEENYPNRFDGVPGNDDCGAMSSWAVFSMMGIYSVDPASEAYELVSPVFPKIVVHLQAPYAGKTFVIETTANPEATQYIQSVTLDGKDHAKNWISYKDIVAGGTLKFALGADANKSWGAAPEDAPPSVSETQP